MKVAVVVPKYGLVGGAERVVFELTERLALQENMDIHVFANAWRAGLAPVTFHRIPRIAFPRCLRPLAFAFITARMTARQRFDLIHSHERIIDMDVFTMHGIPHRTWVHEARGKRMSLFDLAVDRVERRGITRAKPFMLPVSSLVKDELRRVYSLPEDRLKVIHPGIDQKFFHALERERLRADWGFTENDVVILFVGMNFEIKRLDLAMEALASAMRSRHSARPLLLVAGRGDIKHYKARAEELGISKRVRFAGVVEDMAACYASADAFFMPSRFDTFGLVVLEAMAAGLPVIITDRTGAKDVVVSGREGFVIPVDASASVYAECIGRLMDRDKREEMGSLARTAAAAHSWEGVVSRVVEVYHKVLGVGGK
ncbi:MAG TPA: glycosyltransferase family 1 protein [Desulfobacteraceae bacterium]|nr:glycosyltransferase family 1 protein [Desulfobacteraceae bacterium]